MPTLFGVMQYIKKHRPRFVCLENVKGLKAIEDQLNSMFTALHYTFCLIETTPTNFGIMQSRNRVHLVCFHKSLLNELKVDAKFYLPAPHDESPLSIVIKRKLSMMTDIPTFPAKHFKSSEKNLWHFATEIANRKRIERLDTPGWQDMHKSVFKKLRKEGGPTSQELRNYSDEMAPHDKLVWETLPLRCQEIALYFHMLGERSRHIDIFQNLDRVPNQEACAPCLTGNSWVFETSSRHLLNGEEMLALQGITVHNFPKMTSFSNRLLANLAGNAFSGPVFLAVIATALGSV